ncbi:MAG TPA: helix-turn-helix domain-containing protein [Planctomycetota bacterium]|nr:helix-turn-helix domain-containing protein [Planctomycetota bacterium]
MIGHQVCLGAPPVITTIGPGIHVNGDGQRYCAPGRWRLHVYATPVTVLADGRPWEMPAGWAALWPPEVALDARFVGRSVHLCAHFLLADQGERVAIPIAQDLGQRQSAVEAAFSEAVRWFAHTPHRSQARLWDLLWTLADQRALAPAEPEHPALARAQAFIHVRLGQSLSTARIAEAAQCSPNQLLRLFRAVTGTTVVGYVRACRVRRAEHLLRFSDLPVKEIAAEVGIPDLHFFNKTIRAALGAPPRAVRGRR